MEEQKKMIKVLIKEPYKEPYVKEIIDELKSFQEIVGGHIECVEMPGVKNVDIYVNDEGKLDKLAGNFWLPEYEDCVCGTCYMVGYEPETGDNISITDNQIKKCLKYIETYKIPDGLDLYEDFYILNAFMQARFKAEQKKKNAEL